VPILAMNMNVLRDEKYCGSAKVLKIVERIIEFDENPTYQTDLLGESRDTSEISGLVDGILGANQLFTKRATIECDIKKVDETSGVLNALLKTIHDNLLRKRENPYPVVELRKKLISEPYGIPACTLPIFAAIAIRHEVKRLRWGSTNEKNFSKNLVSAFEADSKLTIKLNEFGDKQFAILFIFGQCLGVVREDGIANEDYAPLCATKIREFVKSKPPGIKTSNSLAANTKQLVAFISKVAQSNQDLADFLIELLDVKSDLPHANVTNVIAKIKNLLDDFIKVENAKLHEIKKCWAINYPKDIAMKRHFIERLKQIGTKQALNLESTLSQSNGVDDVDVNELVNSLLSRSFNDCSDSDIGRFIGILEMLYEQCRVEVVPQIQPQPIPTGASTSTGIDLENTSDLGPFDIKASILSGTYTIQIDSTETLKQNIQKVINSLTPTPSKDEIVSVLEDLIGKYKD